MSPGLAGPSIEQLRRPTVNNQAVEHQGSVPHPDSGRAFAAGVETPRRREFRTEEHRPFNLPNQILENASIRSFGPANPGFRQTDCSREPFDKYRVARAWLFE
jgi:hypothetical protein